MSIHSTARSTSTNSRNGAYAGIALLKNDDAVVAPPFDVYAFSLAELWGDGG